MAQRENGRIREKVSFGRLARPTEVAGCESSSHGYIGVWPQIQSSDLVIKANLNCSQYTTEVGFVSLNSLDCLTEDIVLSSMLIEL